MSLLRSMALKGLAALACAVFGFAASAQAAEGMSLDNRSGLYGVIKGGYAVVDAEQIREGGLDLAPDSAYMAGAGVGCYLGAFRIEAEGDYFWGSQDDQRGNTEANLDFDVVTPMANVFLDFPIAERLTGYVGAGAGWAFLNGTIDFEPSRRDLDLDENAFAAQGMVGLGYQLSDKITLTGGYRGVFVTTDNEFWLHTIELGLRFNF